MTDPLLTNYFPASFKKSHSFSPPKKNSFKPIKESVLMRGGNDGFAEITFFPEH